jgi:hypothetical protein
MRVSLKIGKIVTVVSYAPKIFPNTKMVVTRAGYDSDVEAMYAVGYIAMGFGKFAEVLAHYNLKGGYWELADGEISNLT